MPLDISSSLREALRDRGREAVTIVKIRWPNGTKFYGGKAGVYIDTDSNEAIIDRKDLEAEQ